MLTVCTVTLYILMEHSQINQFQNKLILSINTIKTKLEHYIIIIVAYKKTAAVNHSFCGQI